MDPNFGTKLAMFEVYHPYIIPFFRKTDVMLLVMYPVRSSYSDLKLSAFHVAFWLVLSHCAPIHWSIFHLIPQIMSYILVGYMGMGVSTYNHHISRNKHPLTI